MIFTNIGIIRTTMRSNTLAITSRKQQRNNRLTIMLLSVILAFMLLTCPSVIYICSNRLASEKTVSNTKLLVLDLLEALWYTKHALNFILYTLSGQDFRREFFKMIHFHTKKTINNGLEPMINRSIAVTTRLSKTNQTLIDEINLNHRLNKLKTTNSSCSSSNQLSSTATNKNRDKIGNYSHRHYVPRKSISTPSPSN